MILETKRREEQIGSNIDIDGYCVREIKRSDVARDKCGGGLAVYTRLVDGLVFKDYSPDIQNSNHHFVSKESYFQLYYVCFSVAM